MFPNSFFEPNLLSCISAMVASSIVSGLITDEVLSGVNGIFFARKMPSTAEFAMTVLSKCVAHVG